MWKLSNVNHDVEQDTFSYLITNLLLPPSHKDWRGFELALVQNCANLYGKEGVVESNNSQPRNCVLVPYNDLIVLISKKMELFHYQRVHQSSEL